MNERKNIDRIFQEKFKDYEVPAPQDSWNIIESRLKDKEKKRRIIPFWFQLSGVAAALILGFFIFQNNFNSSSTIDIGTEGVVTQQENNDGVLNGDTDQIQPQNDNVNTTTPTSESQSSTNRQLVIAPTSVENKSNGSSLNETINSTNRKKALRTAIVNNTTANTQQNSNRDSRKQQNQGSNSDTESDQLAVSNQNIGKSTKENLASNNSLKTIESNQVQPFEKLALSTSTTNQSQNNILALDENLIAQKLDSAAIATVETNSLEELLNEKENNVTNEEQKVNRWQISSNVAPIYFSSTSEGSPIDPQFSDKKKEYKQNLTYGLGVRYALNDKFTIRAGVNSVAMEYATSDVVFYQTSTARNLAHVDVNLQGSVLQIENKPKVQQFELTLNDNLMQKFDASINQKTGYFEIPIEVSYKLLDKKFGVELIGGMSTLFLTENQISMTSSGTTMEIGKANNLNSTHFSTNVGVGMKYNFLKSFQFNIEPILKYQINAFTDSGNYQPFYFGIYSGVNYRF